MKNLEFKSIYDKLNDPCDIDFLVEETGLDKELLNVIYTQRTTREATKKYHVVKRNAARLTREWKQGKSLLSIARQWRFPPILTGLLIFQENGFSKKQFWKYVREPETIRNQRTQKEIIEITQDDIVYSPWANELQFKRGTWGENQLHEWLDINDISYRTEKDLRGEFPKTPDCLLDKPLRFNGWTLNWIESKASFGDFVEFNRNVRCQLNSYVRAFRTWSCCLLVRPCR